MDLEKYNIYIGKKFNKFTVLAVGHNSKIRGIVFSCKCECGKIKDVSIYSILHNRSRSCGCLGGEVRQKRDAENKKAGKIHPSQKHGACIDSQRTSTYKIWQGMKARCQNKNSSNYENYGGRGIKVCDRWTDKKNGFINFLEDMGVRPSTAHSIDRIEVDGNYEPSNCRWVLDSIQAKNKRTSHFITINGETKILQDWCKEYNIDSALVGIRINSLGWSAEKALQTPSRKPTSLDNTKVAYKLLGHENLIFYALKGSHARGLNIEGSDLDYAGSYVAPLDFYFGNNKDDNFQYNQNGVDISLFEINYLISLLMKSNPNLLELLWTDKKFIFCKSRTFEELLENRYLFLSKNIYSTYINYAKNQVKRMQVLKPEVLYEYENLEILLSEEGISLQDLKAKQIELDRIIDGTQLKAHINRFKELNKQYFSGGNLGESRKNLIKKVGYNSKGAAITILLLRHCIEFLTNQEIQVERIDDRQELLDIKAGKYSLEEIKAIMEDLFRQAEQSVLVSTLPDDVDRSKIEALCIKLISDFYRARL